MSLEWTRASWGFSGFGRVVVALKNFVASDAVRRFVFWPDS
jgi:hypothetical protein